MIQLTDNAILAVKSALARADEPAAGLRVMVETGGCAGFKYMMGLEREAREGDAVVRQDGLVLFVDAQSQAHLDGTTIDFVTALDRAGFVFENPNATSKCSCGKSFS